MASTYIALGLMTGTSCDGLDLALIETDGADHSTTLATSVTPYPIKLQEQLRAAQRYCTEAMGHEDYQQELMQADSLFEESEDPIQSLKNTLTRYQWDAIQNLPANLPKPEVVGLHGQTLFHCPQMRTSIQLHDAETLSSRLGIPVITDFRQVDMENGGQGAPIAPIYHFGLCRGQQLLPAMWINIGGISNITFMPNDRPEDMLAFDAGPGNQLVDTFIRVKTGGAYQYDINGHFGLKGAFSQEHLERCLSSYQHTLSTPLPRSFDKSDFPLAPFALTLSLEDGARILAAMTAYIISQNIKACGGHNISTWIVSGGGTENPCIMHPLKAYANEQGAMICTPESFGKKSSAIEAEMMAYLAVRRMEGKPITFANTTGANAVMSAAHTIA